MQNRILLLLFLVLVKFSTAHTINYDKVVLRHWTNKNGNSLVDGSFLCLKNSYVLIEDATTKVLKYPLESLSTADQLYVIKKNKQILSLNNLSTKNTLQKSNWLLIFNFQFWMVLLLLLSLSAFLIFFIEKRFRPYLVPVLLVGFCSMLYSFTEKAMTILSTNLTPTFIDSSFVPFKPAVHTYWDSTYFYVESKGIPTTHLMMAGISNHGWQQQVPIPQCYIGTNSWPIPLHPVLAANPIPVDSIHFTRGAIAIAVNGVPIFNVHTNTGVDSYLDGQLDAYGGHCGRADDYHYHIAPLHLYVHTASTMPIAFGLDGFAIYGNTEPDGSSMQTLDANHGHFFGGNYHYHGTASAPYMIANLVGQVTEDATHQLIPQAAAHPVRPSLTPLNGALITNCTAIAGGNGYKLSYVLNGQTDSIVYSWNVTGTYTFKFYTQGNGTFTTQNYNGFVQCSVPTAISSIITAGSNFIVFPNPSTGDFKLRLNSTLSKNEIKEISIYNLQGVLVFKTQQFQETLHLTDCRKGIYFLKIKLSNHDLAEKIIIE